MKIGYEALLAEADAAITALSPAEAAKLQGDPGVQFVDVRDVRELAREGLIPGALHAPRGLLEFWVDPASPYHKPVFTSGKRFVFYCAAGWRSSLATYTVQRMGLAPVCHLAGGFTAWREAGLPVVALEPPQAKPESPGGE